VSEPPARPRDGDPDLIAQLRAERDGLRQAMRSRAVIEQAKGVLMARLGIGPDGAFDQLKELSQHTNIRLAEVAAAVVGQAAPAPGEPVVAGRRREVEDTVAMARVPVGRARPVQPARPPELEGLQSQHHLLAAQLGAAADHAEVVGYLAETQAGWPRPRIVMLLVTEPDGALRLVADAGLLPEVRSQCLRIPPQLDIPLTRAVRDFAPVWLDTAEEAAAHFPALREFPGALGGRVALPLIVDGRAVGTVGLSWSTTVELPDVSRQYLVALAGLVARAVDRIERDGPAGTPAAGSTPVTAWIDALLDVALHPTALLAPVRAGGQVTDFVIERLNHLGRAGAERVGIRPIGTSVVELDPALAGWLVPTLAEVLASGVPREFADVYVGGPDPARVAVRLARMGDRVLYSWRVHTEAESMHGQLLAAERIAHIGSFWWDPGTGERRWSPQLSFLLGRTPRQLPRDRWEAIAMIAPADRPAVRRAVFTAIRTGSATVAFRPRQRRVAKWLRLTVEPMRDQAGRLVALRGTVQDISAQQAQEARRQRVEEALSGYRQRRGAEDAVAAVFARTLFPPEIATQNADLVRVRAAHRSATGTPTDWYDVVRLGPDRVLLVTGEVIGAGTELTPTAIRLCHSVRAYAALDLRPAEILAALDEVLRTALPGARASVSLARLDRTSRTVRCATAGPCAPIRFREADRGIRCGPAGLRLGGPAHRPYREEVVPVASGDHLLLHSEGLVLRRGQPARTGLELLLDAGTRLDLDDLDTVIGQLTDKLAERPDRDLSVLTARIP
jgi:PAS domain-containing protein